MPRDTGMGQVRELPANFEAEIALLGAILCKNACYYQVSDLLRPEHFAQGVHGRIYAAAAQLIDSGKTANPVTLKDLFEQDEALAEFGGYKYLTRLAVNVIGTNTADYGRQIADAAQRRAIILACREAEARAFEFTMAGGAADILAEHEQALSVIGDEGQGAREGVDLAAALGQTLTAAEAVHKADGKIIGVPTGLIDLDKALGGLHGGDLIILAGRTAMGKTALATGITLGAAWAGFPALYCSKEMSGRQLGARILAGETGISAERQRKGPLSRYDIERLMDARERFAALPYEIDDTPSSSVAQIRARARRMKRGRGLKLLAVDYIQLLIAGDAENRTQEVSKITRDLKNLAGELDIPVLALSQVSRAVESREDKRPMLSDLRESGSIEQDADIVMFCYREEAYRSKEEPVQRSGETAAKFSDRCSDWQTAMSRCKGIAEAIIAKNRHGAERSVRMRFDGERTQFQDLHQGGLDL